MGDRSIVIYVHVIDCIRSFGWFFHREKGKGGGGREREREIWKMQKMLIASLGIKDLHLQISTL